MKLRVCDEVSVVRARRAIVDARGTIVRGGMELVLAGGLRPETVAEAVRVLEPWGVDVASGVEAEAGVKDVERVRRFVAAVRGLAEYQGPDIRQS